MAKCDYNCFECKHSDCIEDKMSPKETKEISRRDNSYFNSPSRYQTPKPTISRKRKALAW